MGFCGLDLPHPLLPSPDFSVCLGCCTIDLKFSDPSERENHLGSSLTCRSFNPPRDSGLRNLHFKKPTNNGGVHAVSYIVVRASKKQICCFIEPKIFVRYTIILYTTVGENVVVNLIPV